MRVGRYLPGISPDYYRALSFYDRICLNEALDTLLDRENGTDKKEADPEEEAREDERYDREAKRSASRSFDGWGGDADDSDD